MKIGFCGLGEFGRQFVGLFHAHPLVEEVVVADLLPDRVREVQEEHGLRHGCGSLEELLAADVDAIALFTQRWSHAPQAVEALRAGKHVFSAIPAAITFEEMVELVRAVEESGRHYMTAETSYYRPDTIYCRQRFRRGDFGKFVYGEGQYHHDMSHFYLPYMNSNGEEWKRYASFPPMLYGSHSVAHILGVTFGRMTEVSCWWMEDHHEDGIFDPAVSHWGNAFSNQSALFRTSDGGCARINEFRRLGAGETRMSILGTSAGFEELPGGGVVGVGKPAVARCSWSEQKIRGEVRESNGELRYAELAHLVEVETEDIPRLWEVTGVEITAENRGELPDEFLGRRHRGVSCIHPVERLPVSYVGLPNGIFGSQQFLVNDFVLSVERDLVPPLNVWMAARLNLPGILAHESSRRGGERLVIPDLGGPPMDRPRLWPEDWEWRVD